MEGKYSQQNIDQFFNQFKKLANLYKLDKVHQLIDDPNAKPKHLVKFNHIPFRLIIMTGTLITIVTVLVLWLVPEKPLKTNNTLEKTNVITGHTIQDKKQEEKNKIDTTEKKTVEDIPKITPAFIKDDDSGSLGTNIIDSELSLIQKDENTECFCDWPSDTVLNKKALFVYLSNTELEILGVFKNDTSGYFKSKHQGSNTWVYNNGDKVFRNRVVDKNYGLTFITDTSMIEPSLSLFRSYEGFYLTIDTLVPIVVTFKNGLKPEILWFTSSEDLFKLLPSRYQNLQHTYYCIKQLKLSQNKQHKQVVNYKYNSFIQDSLLKIKAIELNDDELKNIYIESTTGYFSVRNEDNSKYFWVDESKKEYGIDLNYKAFRHNFFPIFITDSKGRHRRVDNNFDIHDKNVVDSIKNENINVLIPIKVHLKEIRIKENEITLWYLPTDEFIDALPDRIKHELKIERNAIINDSLNFTSTCTYFEVCKSTLSVENLRVFPNPTKQSVTIEFSVYESAVGNISLYNIGGSQVKVLLSNQTFVSRNNSFKFELSDVTPGIYLVSLQTDKGFLTQRLIISR
jgi:hypothetical protein